MGTFEAQPDDWVLPWAAILPEVDYNVQSRLGPDAARVFRRDVIATLDVRDFAAATLKGRPALWPRDL